jgi:hypothetical protein
MVVDPSGKGFELASVCSPLQHSEFIERMLLK